ncbi:MAG: DNA polymerase III subunit beta [Lachnospiraceae bacterium]|uniref:Beta sliding clamp n=1 Tax=Candidatus Weimeria bifida TaxID=2599074 RepID=A0A6N7J091_9FIRM|nr:DNA polymerase III subunit beta [Candidatus Weimeria bifida]RRF96906.1 MAG: DNA polymerase III subunit beta [Lachnospiraceae bacterium]
MKISCSQSALQNSVNVVSKAVPGKTPMPILECILLKTENNVLKLTASNMDLGIESIVTDTIVEEEGYVALDAKLFSDMVRNLPADTVYIESDDQFHTTIRCGKAEYKIIGKSGQDFPKLPIVKIDEPVVLSQLTLKNIITQTSFAAAVNEANKMMTGVFMEIHENQMKMVALDGHRISIRVIELKQPYPDHSAVIPGKSLNEIVKNLSSEQQNEAMIYFTENQMIVDIENTTMVVRLIDGEYFNYEQMIRAQFKTKVIINRRELMEGINRATLLVKEGDKKPVIINVTEDKLELMGNSAVGTLKEDIPVVKEGNDLMIGFNPRFLLDALRVIDDEQVTMYLMDAKSPAFFKNDTETYNYIILPVNFLNQR